MKPFQTLTAIAMPLVRPNIDTDAIIPSREIRGVAKTGLAGGLFAGWRYTTVGGRESNPDFVMNDPAYRDARILLAGENMGCGSSREHAAWALAEYGFQAIVAPSFNPIFHGNCVRNGIAPVRLPLSEVETLAQYVSARPGRTLTIDLAGQSLITPAGRVLNFDIGDEDKLMLLEGLDPIELTLKRDDIAPFIAADRAKRPWVYL